MKTSHRPGRCKRAPDRLTRCMAQVVIQHIFISPGHNFFGHHGMPPGSHPTIEVARAMCRAGRGIEGDRFFGYRPDYNGQITFFDGDVFETAKRVLGVPTLSPGAFRRNVIVAGLDLNALVEQEFSLGDVTFRGMAEARPCHWMDEAVAPGAEDWLKGRGGLRARILSDGELCVGPVAHRFVAGQMSLLPE